MHSYQFHRRRSMVRASTGPDLGSRSEERSGSSAEQAVPSPIKSTKILPKRSSSAAARVITVRPCSRSTTLMSMSNSDAGSIDEDVFKTSTSSYKSPLDRSRSSSVVPAPSRTNSSLSLNVQISAGPSNTNSSALKVLPYLTISSTVEASDEQFLCDHKIRFMINLTGDDSRSYMKNRCKCGKDSMHHSGKQQKLTIKLYPKAAPEVIFRQLDQIAVFITKARKYANGMILVFNETGENEVEAIPILYMMQYFNSERSRAEAQIIKALENIENPRRDGSNVCTMSIDTRHMLDLWWNELKRRSTQQLAGDVNQLNFNKVKERAPIRAAWP